jgi:5S rRNA maturation endonuclease (ribonuclease M5)
MVSISTNIPIDTTKCKLIACGPGESEKMMLLPGWGCCQCRIYNGLQRTHCKKCGHPICIPAPMPSDFGLCDLGVNMNLIEALDAARIEWKKGKNSEEIWICCCFCMERGETQDTRFRLGVNLRTGFAQCFNCEWKARGEFTFNKLQEALDTGQIEALQHSRHEKHEHKEKPVLPPDFELLRPHSKDEWQKKAYRYVKHRNVSDSQIKEKKIGYSMVGETAYRVVFPVYVRNKLKGLVSRDFTGKQEIPYRNSVGGKALYNVPDKNHKTVVLLEGVFDALRVEQASKKLHIDSCALLGHSLTDDQIELLDPYKTIILYLDPDEAGVKGALSVVQKLHSNCHNKTIRVVLPRWVRHVGANDTDPSELEIKEITHRLAHAVLFTEEIQLTLKAAQAFKED